jgi:hypothetical protein
MKSAATSAKHSSENGEHVTPIDVAMAARAVLQTIELDPASDELANSVIRAKRIFTKEYDGLAQRWSGRVFLNPPGGKLGNESLPKLWWKKLAEHWRAGDVECAIFVGFSIEILQTTQSLNEHDDIDKLDYPIPLDFPFCVPSRRLRFLHEQDGKLVPGANPTHASVFIYLPPRSDHNGVRFEEHFARFGEVRR